jgi:translation initiation factor 5A
VVNPVTAKTYVPTVERRTGQVLSVSEKSVQLMDMGTYETLDVPITAEDKPKLEQGKEVPFLNVMGRTKLDIR